MVKVSLTVGNLITFRAKKCQVQITAIPKNNYGPKLGMAGSIVYFLVKIYWVNWNGNLLTERNSSN